MGLRKEWRSVSMMIKNQQSFNTYSLNDVYNQLKTHESEVYEIMEEAKQSFGGPLALVSKVSEMESTEKENSDEEGLILNSNDEVIAFYSNNRVKKYFKKPFNPKGKQSEMKGNLTKSGVEEKRKFVKTEKNDDKVKEFKAEKKLKGDSGIDCHYYNGANHFAIDCMLRKKEEKKNRVKDEAYYATKLEEVRAKTKKLSFVARGEVEDEESGTY